MKVRNVVRFARHCSPDYPCSCVTVVSLSTVPPQEDLSLFSSNPTFLIPLSALSTDAQSFLVTIPLGPGAHSLALGSWVLSWGVMSPGVMGQVHVEVVWYGWPSVQLGRHPVS